MDSLHSILHELNENLIDIRSVLKASDELTTEMFKKHLTLIRNTAIKVDSVQDKVDRIFNNRVDVHRSDTGAYM